MEKRPLRSVEHVPGRLLSPCFGRSLKSDDLTRLEDLPDHDLKILDALVQKKENEIARSLMADRYNQLWYIESETRKKAIETGDQEYKKLLMKKREMEQNQLNKKRQERYQNDMEFRHAREISLRGKFEKYEKAKASLEENKMSQRVERSLHNAQRTIMAEWRRLCTAKADATARLRLLNTQRGKLKNAATMRDQYLWDSSKRCSIVNWLSQKDWERCRMEVFAKEFADQAAKMEKMLKTEERVANIKKKKIESIQRSREQAAVSSALRKAVLSIKDVEIP